MTLVEITGWLYDASTGEARTSGQLRLTPTAYIPNGDDMVAPVTATYTLTASEISLEVSPSYGVDYIVEFDPDPADTLTPRALKSGYFKARWDVPATGPIDIADL